MFAAFREYSLDVWDWLVGNQYPRQKQLDYLKTTHSLITADLKPEQELTQRDSRASLVETQGLPSEIKVDFKPEHWQETHPESSVCITQEAKPRVLTAYTSEHEEF